MNNQRLLQIQGPRATGFKLNATEKKALHSILTQRLGRGIQIISSRFRSDLFYTASEDQSEWIIQSWCGVKKRRFFPSLVSGFASKSGLIEILEYYFVTLLCLASTIEAFQEYCDHFNLQAAYAPQSEILRHIRQCNSNVVRELTGDSGEARLLTKLNCAIISEKGRPFNRISLEALAGFHPN